MPEMIEVEYTCGCKARGHKPTRATAGVPKYCPAHGTAGDDMVVKESGEESATDSTDEPTPADPANPEGE